MKKRITPGLEHLISAGTPDGLLTQVLRGHLIIESLLVKLIELKLERAEKFDLFQLSFPQKINLCLSLNLIREDIVKLLKELNLLRNRYSHELGYILDFKETIQLFDCAYEIHGIEFSEELLSKMDGFSHEEIELKLEIDELISEIFNATAACLDNEIEVNGGKAPLLG